MSKILLFLQKCVLGTIIVYALLFAIVAWTAVLLKGPLYIGELLTWPLLLLALALTSAFLYLSDRRVRGYLAIVFRVACRSIIGRKKEPSPIVNFDNRGLWPMSQKNSLWQKNKKRKKH